MSALLEVRDLSVTFPGQRRAVHRVSFDVRAGETVALVGESGSGKTTVAHALMGLLPRGVVPAPDSHALFEGRDVFALSSRDMRDLCGRRIAMVFQEPATALNPVMRVGDQIAEVAVTHEGDTWNAGRARATAMLARTGIRDVARVARAYPHELSGGMRQRVMIAMALLLRPALVIADEPTSALDVTVQAQILSLLAELQRDAGTAVLLITHDLGIVAQECARAYVMSQGEIVESADTETLFNAPVHAYTAELLRAVPRLVVPA